MKRLVGLALFAALGWYLWKNWFSQIGPRDPSAQAVAEVELKNEIGDNKRAVQLANQVPISTYDGGPYAGVPLTPFTEDILKQAHPLVLLPTGTSPNPYHRVIWS